MEDCVEVFNFGVDDFMVKLFVYVEFLVCLYVLMCCGDSVLVLLEVGCLVVDLCVCVVYVDGVLLVLLLKEYVLLVLLLVYCGWVFLCVVLFEGLYDVCSEVLDKVIEVLVSILCIKLV